MIPDDQKVIVGDPLTNRSGESVFAGLQKYNEHTHKKAFSPDFLSFGIKPLMLIEEVDVQDSAIYTPTTVNYVSSNYLQLSNPCLKTKEDATYKFSDTYGNQVEVPHLSCNAGEARLFFAVEKYDGFLRTPDTFINLYLITLADLPTPFFFTGAVDSTSIVVRKIKLITPVQNANCTVKISSYSTDFNPSNETKVLANVPLANFINEVNFDLQNAEFNSFINANEILTVTTSEEAQFLIQLNYQVSPY